MTAPIRIFEGRELYVDSSRSDSPGEVLFDVTSGLRLVSHDSADHVFRIAAPGRYFDRLWGDPWASNHLADSYRSMLPGKLVPPPLRQGDYEDGRPYSGTTGPVTREYVPRAAGHTLGLSQTDLPPRTHEVVRALQSLRQYALTQLLMRPLSEPLSTKPNSLGFWWMSGDQYSRTDFLDTGRGTGWKTSLGWDAADTAHAHHERLGVGAALGEPAALFAIALLWRIHAYCHGTTNYATQPRGLGWVTSLAATMWNMRPTQEFTERYCSGIEPIELVDHTLVLLKDRWWKEENGSPGIYERQWDGKMEQGIGDLLYNLPNGMPAGSYVLTFHLAIAIAELGVAARRIPGPTSPAKMLRAEAAKMATFLVERQAFGPEGTVSRVVGPYDVPDRELLDRMVTDGNAWRRALREQGKDAPNDVTRVGSVPENGSWVEIWRKDDAELFAGAISLLLADAPAALPDVVRMGLSDWLRAYRYSDDSHWVYVAPLLRTRETVS